jgi:dolichyl-phosphate beta-glucosyltransferase
MIQAAPVVTDAAPTVSLIIPTYNQRGRTVRALADAKAYLSTHFGDRAELIVVDDGSEPDKAMRPGDLPSGTAFVGLPENQGKGGAIRAGVASARGTYVVFTDSDLRFSLDPLHTTLAWLADSADIVIGDRLHPESVSAIDVTPTRQLSSVVYTWMVKNLLDLDFPDTQCGYKGYRAPVAKELFGSLEVTSFAFEAEILLRARKAGYRVRRQPLRLVHDEDTSVRLTRHAPRMILDIFRIAWRARRGRYERHDRRHTAGPSAR